MTTMAKTLKTEKAKKQMARQESNSKAQNDQ
jgi:hypothetical protein